MDLFVGHKEEGLSRYQQHPIAAASTFVWRRLRASGGRLPLVSRCKEHKTRRRNAKDFGAPAPCNQFKDVKTPCMQTVLEPYMTHILSSLSQERKMDATACGEASKSSPREAGEASCLCFFPPRLTQATNLPTHTATHNLHVRQDQVKRQPIGTGGRRRKQSKARRAAPHHHQHHHEGVRRHSV